MVGDVVRQKSRARRTRWRRSVVGTVTVAGEGMVCALCGAALRSEETHRSESKYIDCGLPCFFIMSISIEWEYTVCHASWNLLAVNEGGGSHSQQIECGSLLYCIFR